MIRTIIAIALLLLTVYILSGIEFFDGRHAHGEEFMVKNVTISIQKGEFIWIMYGNPDKPTVETNKLDMDKRQLYEVENFLEAYVKDRVERFYIVEVEDPSK